MTTKKKTKKSDAIEFVEKLAGGPLTLGTFLCSIREGEEWSQAEMGRRLGVSRAHICDLEKGRRGLSPTKAAKWARILGYHEGQMVELALQAQVDSAKLKYTVKLDAA